MLRILIAAALLLPAACKDEKKAPPAKLATPPAAEAKSAEPAARPAAPPTGEQTMTQAMELICDAPNRAAVPADATDSERAMLTATWIKDNVTNPEALKLMGGLASVMPEDRGSMLADEAKKHGIGTCALAQMK